MPYLLLIGTEMGQNLRLMQTPLLICKGSLLSGPMPRLAAHLFKQAHIRHGHAAVSGFAHVVDGQQADLYGGRKSVDFPRKSHC